MEQLATRTQRLTIKRLHAEYLISEQQPEPARLKAQLDESISQTPTLALSAALAHHFAGQDTSVWLIRRLHIAVDVNANWQAEASGRAWASQIEQTLATVLDGGADGENILRFPNPAAYLARFLVDVANGSAWGKWHYEPFAGLRLLSTSATLRTAIADRPDEGRDALLQLSSYEVRRLLAALESQDARRLLDHLAAASANGTLHHWETLWAAWEALALDPTETSGDARQALHLYITAGQMDPHAAGAALRSGAYALLQLARSLAQSSASQGEELLACLMSKELAGLYLLAGASDGERMSPLLTCEPAWLRHAGQTLLDRTKGEAAAAFAGGERRDTTLGGIFLLLPLLDELPLAEATVDWPGCSQLTALTLLRFLILIKTCGSANARRAFYDPLVRDLMGIPGSLILADLREWQRALTAHHRQTLPAALSSWQQSRATLGKHYLLARVPARGAPLAVLFESERGLWLCIIPYRSRHLPRLAVDLHQRLVAEGHRPEYLLCDPALLAAFDPASLPCRLLSLQANEVGRITEGDPGTKEVLARLDKVADDLAFLALPNSFGVAPALDRALSVMTQSLLRTFAGRLPGFAYSSLPYLHTNFLDFSAGLEEAPEQRIVHLGKPLLHLVLNMTGMTRSTYHLSWLEDRQFVLRTE